MRRSVWHCRDLYGGPTSGSRLACSIPQWSGRNHYRRTRRELNIGRRRIGWNPITWLKSPSIPDHLPGRHDVPITPTLPFVMTGKPNVALSIPVPKSWYPDNAPVMNRYRFHNLRGWSDSNLERYSNACEDITAGNQRGQAGKTDRKSEFVFEELHELVFDGVSFFDSRRRCRFPRFGRCAVIRFVLPLALVISMHLPVVPPMMVVAMMATVMKVMTPVPMSIPMQGNLIERFLLFRS